MEAPGLGLPLAEPDPGIRESRRENGRKRRGERLWELLRTHVRRGFFHQLLNTGPSIHSDFLTLVERLWNLVHKFSPVRFRDQKHDSTTTFVVRGWARIRAERHRVERRVRGGATGVDDSGDKRDANMDAGDLDNRSDDADSDQDDNADRSSGLGGRKGMDWMEGLSLDVVPEINVSRELGRIARGLVHFNRAWKLLLLGLGQAESIARYLAMVALRRAIPVINDTLLDATTREGLVRVLVNLMHSDEREENRVKAVWLLGQLGFYLGNGKEHGGVLMVAFKELVKQLLEIQWAEKRQHPPIFTSANRTMKIHLLHAIGKYTRFVHAQSRMVEDLAVYCVWSEFQRGDTKDGGGFVVRSLLGILNNELKRTDANMKYVGALFKKYIHPLMRSPSQPLQKLAVQFISNWLPIVNDDALLVGLETVKAGCEKAWELLGKPEGWQEEAKDLNKRTRTEEARLALRAKLLRQLLQIPSTFTNLIPVPDHPGFFVQVNSSMLYTKGVVVNLPIHPKSSVTLTRILPSIPGVPQGVTTIPPVFMDPLWAERQPAPQSRYEYLERMGQVPGLPIGYTYAPCAMVDVSTLIKPEADDKTLRSDGQRPRRAAILGGEHASTAAAASARMTREPAELQSANSNRISGSSRPRRQSVQGPEGPVLLRRSASRDSSNSLLAKRPALKPRGEIPPGTARMPQKPSAETQVTTTDASSRRAPPSGFMSVCPFPGYDPDRIDRAAWPVSAIYGKQMGPGRGPPLIAGASPVKNRAESEAGKPGADVPEGYTVDRHPVLWPSRIPNLRSAIIPTDFPINAPVIFDIIQPGSTRLQRVMTRVTSINREMAAVSVQREADEEEGLSVGATFNIFIRTRQNPTEWISVNLEVVDDDYQDDISYSKPKPLGPGSSPSSVSSLAAIKGADKGPHHLDVDSGSPGRHMTLVPNAASGGTGAPLPLGISAIPIPAGFTSSGEPYFSTPVNIPPFPVGYTVNGVPYFGRTSSIKPPPLGLTTQGVRFYPADGKLGTDASGRNVVAGYDNGGHPFFIPRGCSVPPPTGYTTDGIGYYDIPTLVHHRGVMVLPASEATRANWPVFEDEEDEDWDEDVMGSMGSSRSSMDLTRRGSRTALGARRRYGRPIDQALITAQLVESLEESQPQVKRTFLKGRQRTIGTIRRVAEFRKLAGFDTEDIEEEMDAIQDPEDLVSFLRESEDVAYLRPTTMRVAIDPSVLDFQSVHAPVAKSVLLRYRAGRGDYVERDFFVSVEPVDVFAVTMFHVRLQGEGVMEIPITYYPTAMKTDRVEGSLSLIDDAGKKIGTCTMVALRQSFIKVSPAMVDAGWTLPDRRKEVHIKIENISNAVATVSVQMQSDLQSELALGYSRPTTTSSDVDQRPLSKPRTSTATDAEKSKRESAFIVPTRHIKLQAHESKVIAVYFEPIKLGHFADTVDINGPGGDLIHVKITGIAGIPIAVYPEDEENSKAGAAELTRERCDFMRKFRRADTREKAHVALTATDTAILKNMMSATSDQESRKEAHTMNFGICRSEKHERMRCLTLMNMSDSPITVGLYAHHPAIRCPYLVRIAPRMANTVEIFFDVGEEPNAVRGNFRSAVEIICPEFQNIPLNIRAFVGQPVFFPVWECAFFKPCRIHRQEQLTLNLINETQFQLQLIVENLGEVSNSDLSSTNSFTSSVSTDEINPTTILPFSTMPVTFTFWARQRGPLLQSLSFRIVKPFNLVVPAALMNKTLNLVGLCIEPYVHRPGEIPDKNSIDFLRMWMSHPKRLVDEYPAPEEKARRFDLTVPPNPYTPTNTECEVMFARESVTFRSGGGKATAGQMAESSMRRSHGQAVLIHNRAMQSRNITFFTSTSFSIDPRAKLMGASDADNVELMFMPPSDASDIVSCYGFGAALLDHDHTFHAIQMVGKPAFDFLVFPIPNKERTVMLDFGRLEVSTFNMDINVKHLVLCNAYDSTYSWNVKFTATKQKYSTFDAAMIMGELQPLETFAIPFRFHSDASGSYETSAEIYIKEALDRLAKPTKLVTVILRGSTVNTSMTGIPETLDFGSTVVFQKKRKTFTVTNNGSTEAQLTILSRPPFDVTPKTFLLAPKGQQEVQVAYSPIESRISQIKLYMFSNQKLYLMVVSGTGGTAELICEKYENKDVDFGFQREGTVGWLSLYVTNKGTLPLTLKAVTADNLDLVKLEYLGVTSTVPYEVNRGAGRNLNAVVVRRDYWSILKRKLEVFAVLKQLLQKTTGVRRAKNKTRRQEAPSQEEGRLIRVHKTGAINAIEHSLVPIIPQLRPFYSYHFRMGYISRYQAKKDTDLIFHYMPITTDEDASTLPSLMKGLTVHIVGSVYRPLEVYPPYHDFGLAPAEAYRLPEARRMGNRGLEDAYGVVRERKSGGLGALSLEVVNMSLEAQNLTLQFINPEFTINGRAWTLQAGEKLFIPVEFHPPKEQIQYHGEAQFQHNYGSSVVRLAGTGASAELSTEEKLDYGCLKVGSLGSRILRLHNRGLLDCRYILEIVQGGQEFTLLSEEPFDHQGVIESGAVESLEVECQCDRLLDAPAHIFIRWQRVPDGPWEELKVPLLVQVGMPVFRLQNMELDFHTTYINVNKTLEFIVTNDGNAVCNWEADSETPILVVEPEGGALEPGQTIVLEVTFSPADFEPLRHNINFYTDAGTKTLMCYGIVGIPYLRIQEDDMFMDFGIVEINKQHIHPVVFTNTGRRHIEFEITLMDVTQDGLEMALEEFDVFFIEPMHEIIEPGESITIQMQVLPREYNAIYAAEWIVRTRDGEQYRGRLSATGGKAIIKLAPPTMVGEDVLTRKPLTAEMSTTPPSRGKDGAMANAVASAVETAKQTFSSHLENLQEVLAGLRAAELAARSAVAPRPPTSSRPTSVSRASSARRRLIAGTEDVGRPESARGPRTSGVRSTDTEHYMDELSHLEDELDASIGKGDGAGQLGKDGRRKIGPMSPSTSRPMSSRSIQLSEDSLRRASEVGTEQTVDTSKLQKPIENLIHAAEEMLADASSVADPQVQRNLLAAANERVLSSTRNVIKAVKEQLANPWIENRDFLTSALRRLQQSTHVMETLEEGTLDRDAGGNNFDIGLIKAGEKTAPILLFNLPNVGNMSFDYFIQLKADERMVPPEYVDEDHEGELFTLQPPLGTISPRESVNISAVFQSKVPGNYQQMWEVISGGEVVLTFTTTARVGTPILGVNPSTIDFGLVSRQKTAVRTFIVENQGSYKDIFRVEAVVASSGDYDAPLPIMPFALSTYKGEIEPGSSIPIQATFTAPQEGGFTQKFRIVWSKDPLTLELKGTGGGWRIKPVYLDETDVPFGGLDWGTCVVGVTYEKSFQLTNLGNVEAHVDLMHSNESFRFEVARDTNGRIRVSPGSHVDVKTIFWPSKTEVIKEGVQIRLPEQQAMVIPLRAITGITGWSVDGQLNFTNMPVLEIQSQSLKVTNTGSLDIPLTVRLEPMEVPSAIGIKVTNWKEGEPLKPGNTAEVGVTVAPQKPCWLEGKVIITTNLGKGFVDRQQPFKLRAYEEQLGVDDDSDISVGRVMVGEVPSVKRSLVNFGSTKIKYRMRIEPVIEESGDGSAERTRKRRAKKKGKTPPGDKGKTWAQLGNPWKLTGPTEGQLDTEESVEFETAFDSTVLDEDDDWQEAKLIIEKATDDAGTRWVVISTFKLSGAVGNPKLTIEPAEIDFGQCGIGGIRERTIIFRNDGTAIVSYEIQPHWDWESVIGFASTVNLQGKVDPGEEIPVPIIFKPDQHGDFISEIEVKTQVDVKKVIVKGHGAEFKLYVEGLPESVDLGPISIGESQQRKLVVYNDCQYGIDVHGAALKEKPTNEVPDPELSTEIKVDPHSISLLANKVAGERNNATLTLHIQAPLPTDDSGKVDGEKVTQLVRMGLQSGFLRLSVLGGTSHVVPLAYRWAVSKLTALLAGATVREGGRYLESDKLKRIDFGEAGLREFTCELKGVDISDETVLPQSESFSGTIEIASEIESLGIVTLEVNGTLVDEPLPLESPAPVAFGPVQSKKAKATTFAFRNPVRRPLKWRFHVDPSFADVFEVEGAAEGVAASRQEISIAVKFKPHIAVSYEATGYVETDEGSFPVTFVGAGVDPAVVLDTKFANFGVVGMDNPEFREIEIKNPTSLPMRVAPRTSSDAFTTDVRVLEIPPGESRKVKVYFNPNTSAQEQRGKIAFINLDDVEEEEEEATMELGPREELWEKREEKVEEPTMEDMEREGIESEEGAEIAEMPTPRQAKPRVKTPRTRRLKGTEKVLDVIELQGTGGEFGFTATPTTDDTGQPEKPSNAIRLTFPKVPEKQRVRKHFEVENVGDTVIDLGVTDANGVLLLENVEHFSETSKVSYKISPVTAQIRPKTRQSFTVVVKGLKPGDDKIDLSLRTRTLVAPKTIPIKVTTKVVSAMELLSDSLKAFARADNSIESMIDYEKQEEMKYGGDTAIWKLLLPVLRLNPLLPSQELSSIPLVEPNVAEPDITPTIVRPPAIPRELPPRAKKWYMNRVSMALDQGTRGRADMITPLMERRQKAAEFVQPVEKKVFLERSGRR
ncbi:hypothetical protein BC832DRAFT_540384 [Gaertneriomyces semiglobifer]|nr:hypothetical protein BC832DRAFT_540384 [Gaertneriomyces semiglobifer]